MIQEQLGKTQEAYVPTLLPVLIPIHHTSFHDLRSKILQRRDPLQTYLCTITDTKLDHHPGYLRAARSSHEPHRSDCTPTSFRLDNSHYKLRCSSSGNNEPYVDQGNAIRYFSSKRYIMKSDKERSRKNLPHDPPSEIFQGFRIHYLHSHQNLIA